jgi:hypothetical protein
MEHSKPLNTILKATNKQLIRGEISLTTLRDVFSKLKIDSQHKLLLAKKSNTLKIPSYYAIDKICLSKTGQSFDQFFGFKRSVTKPRQIDRLMQPEFIERFKNWCSENSINSVPEYTIAKGRPKEFPTTTTIVENYGYDYFTDVIGLKRYKDTIEDKLLEKEFTDRLKNWCIENNITSVNRYINTTKPKEFPSAERIRQILGSSYFEEILEITVRNYTFLSIEEARTVCIENGILTSNSYPKFYQFYNQSHEVKLPSDPYRYYNTNWSDFIRLSETQLFIGNSMSSLELFTYKLLHDRGIEFELEKTFDDCRSKNPLPFDFYLPNTKSLPVIIELDGEQHRIITTNKRFNHSIIQKHDTIKNEYCKTNGIELIRINHLIEIEPTLIDKISLDNFQKHRDLDWTTDFQTESDVLNSQLSKSMKVKLLLLMAEKGKCQLSNVEIIKLTKIKRPPFYGIKNELISLGLINRETDYYFSETEIERIISLYKEGKTVSEIIRQTGYRNRDYLIKRLRDAGINYGRKKATPEQSEQLRQEIKQMLTDGLRIRDIVKKTGKSSGFISVIAKEIKIENGEIEPDEKHIQLGDKIRQGLADGKTMKQLIDELGYSRQLLNKCLIWTKKYASR